MKRKLVTCLAIGAIASIQVISLTSQSTAGSPCNIQEPTKVGTSGHDVLRGTNQRDLIKGRQGNDTIIGRGRRDILCGNEGNDSIYGGRGEDTLEGGNGNDNLYGGRGNDSINATDGVQGNDWLDGQADDASCTLDMGDEESNCFV
jgi:Ca2+-binding RTX toxin-like protein